MSRQTLTLPVTITTTYFGGDLSRRPGSVGSRWDSPLFSGKTFSVTHSSYYSELLTPEGCPDLAPHTDPRVARRHILVRGDLKTKSQRRPTSHPLEIPRPHHGRSGQQSIPVTQDPCVPSPTSSSLWDPKVRPYLLSRENNSEGTGRPWSVVVTP